VHYLKPKGASLKNGNGVVLLPEFRHKFFSTADDQNGNSPGYGPLSVVYSLITTPTNAVFRNALIKYQEYKQDFHQKRGQKRDAHKALVIASHNEDPQKNAWQKVRGLYPQMYSVAILEDDDTPGGMTGQFLEYEGGGNTLQQRKKMWRKNLAPKFTPLMQKKWEVLALEAQQHNDLNPGVPLNECMRAAVDNAKRTNFCLHKDMAGEVYTDPAVQRVLHFNHARGQRGLLLPPVQPVAQPALPPPQAPPALLPPQAA